MVLGKRLLPALLVMLMVFSMLPMAVEPVYANEPGEEIAWTPLPGAEERISYHLSDEGTLRIQGEGEIPNYTSSSGGRSPFYTNKEIKNLIIGDKITRVGDYTFTACEALETVILPDGIQSIGNSAFSSCIKLATVNMPDGLETIEYEAFYGCGLKSIMLPDTVTDLGHRAFSFCRNARTLKLSKKLKSIDYYTFSYCYRLRSIEIPNGVTTLGEGIFGGCTDLKKVTIPASVKSMTYTFSECFGLDEVIFEGDYPETFDGAFYACNLTARYPYGNDTWTEDARDSGYGGKVKWEGYCLNHVKAAAVKENVKAATVLKAGSYQEVVYCKKCHEKLSSKTVKIAKLKPTIKLSATKKTLKKGKTFTLKVSKLARGDAVKSFKTTKKSVATVNKKGKIKAINKGKTVIIVTLKSGKKATCKVTVK